MSRDKLKEERKRVKDGAERETGQAARINELESMISMMREEAGGRKEREDILKEEVDVVRLRLSEAERKHVAKDEVLTGLNTEAERLRAQLDVAMNNSQNDENDLKELRKDFAAAVLAIRKMHKVRFFASMK